jgi:acyl-CoA thioesterase-1
MVFSGVSAGAASSDAAPPVILVFGDSISAGYGLARVEDGWVGLLRTKLKS